MAPIRTTILTSIMAPHRIAPFNALAAHADIELSVVYLAKSDPSRRWSTDEHEMRFAHLTLKERARLRRGESYVHVTSGLSGALRAMRPEVLIVGGWDQPAYHAALLGIGRAVDRRTLLWVESNLRDRRDERPLVRRAKARLLRRVDGVIVPGTASADYVDALGVDPGRVMVAPNAVDNDLFARASADRSGRTEAPRFLFVGRLESAKGLGTLLDAWQRARPEASLTLVGSGSLRDAIRRRLERFAILSVGLIEHMDRDDLAAAYGDADVFVFPSVSDPWGLVINEAMASGLPVIVSSSPGAVDDLVTDGENGMVVPPYEPGLLADAIDALTRDPDRRLAMGERSRERIARFGPQDWAEAVAEAVRRPKSEAA